MQKRNIAATLAAAAVLAGCTTAGPYVTNISSDGRNGLNIEKCAVHLNAFMGTVSTSDCTSQHIQLTPYQASAPGYVPSQSYNSRSVDAQLEDLRRQNLPYEEYQRRYREIMEQ